jgi:hypothetical protein
MTFASKPLDTCSSQVIAEVRTGITVASIATPRDKLVCRETKRWPGFKDESDIQQFDHVPVTDGEDGEIVGVFDRKKGICRPLSEAMFLASDAGLLSFLEIADRQEFAFLVHQSRIAGLVTISDIQRLPVYCVLFTLLMSVEMLLMEWIRESCQLDPEKWLEKLDRSDQTRINSLWQRAQSKNVALDKLSYANFTQELTAAESLGLFASDPEALTSLRDLIELRNDVCHGKEIAPTLDRAMKVPTYVRKALSVEACLNDALGKVRG